MTPILVSVLVAAAAGLIGTVAVLLLARHSLRAAAVAAPVVVVLSMAGGVAASVQTMAVGDAASATIVLVLAATVPVAVLTGLVLSRQLGIRDRAANQREAELERDRQVELRRRELVTWMSHDLRTPLAGMTAITEALQDGVAPDPSAYLAKLHDESLRVNGMVTDLLALSRLQSPGAPTPREDASLRDIVSEVLEQARPVAERAGVRLTGEGIRPVLVRVNGKEVARAAANLVANAVRHTAPGGEVRVDVSEADGWACVRVADECGGIPAAHLPHVFEPGWRGTPGRGPADGAGAGLGLTITRGVADAHGGTVSVRNGTGGCVFELRLPSRP